MNRRDWRNSGSSGDARGMARSWGEVAPIRARKVAPDGIDQITKISPKSRIIGRCHRRHHCGRHSRQMALRVWGRSPGHRARRWIYRPNGNPYPTLRFKGGRQGNRPIAHDSPKIVGSRSKTISAPFREITATNGWPNFGEIRRAGRGRGIARKWALVSRDNGSKSGMRGSSASFPRTPQDRGQPADPPGDLFSGANRGYEFANFGGISAHPTSLGILHDYGQYIAAIRFKNGSPGRPADCP